MFTQLEAVGDGVYVSFRDLNGNALYEAELSGNEWRLTRENGAQTLYTLSENERTFTFRITLDLDNRRSTTYINQTFCGTFALEGGKSPVFAEYRFGTTEASTGSVTCSAASARVNYALYEYFDVAYTAENGAVLPFGFSGDDGALTSAGTLKLSGGAEASAAFESVGGAAAVEYKLLLPEREQTSFSLLDGKRTVVTVSTDENAMYVNGESVYADYYANLWYRLRLECDPASQTVTVKVNGRTVSEQPYACAAASFDRVIFACGSETEAKFDDVKVFRLADHEDYVAEPVIPKNTRRYNVGMISCPMWNNGGSHYGWMCITPYPEHEPALGYYDEGNPELADWEIKYMLEHGVDFENFVIFFGRSTGPQELITSDKEIFDGFMNAKYSSLMKFSVMMECAAGAVPATLEQWKENYVPLLIEYFFKDERYLTVDGKIVFSMLGEGNMAGTLGEAGFKEALAYLDEEVRKLGFDGVLLLSSASTDSRLEGWGYDASYAYNLGGNYLYENAKMALENRRTNSPVYDIPLLASGYDSIPWWGIRDKVMTGNDFRKLCEYVKEGCLPTYLREAWQKNFLMLGVWNEWGEGTYLCPTAYDDGFAYLDAVRAFFTDAEYHFAPTALRYEGLDGVQANADGSITVTASGTGSLYFDSESTLDTADYKAFILKASSDLNFRLYYRTTTSGAMSESRKLPASEIIRIDDTYSYYVFDLSSGPDYSGSIPAGNTVFMLTAFGTGTSVIADAYVADRSVSETDLTPTDAQKARITRLYPQRLKLLRRQGWYKETYPEEYLETVGTIDFRSSDYSQDDYGTKLLGIANAEVTAEGLVGVSTDNDPIIYVKSEMMPENLVGEDIYAIRMVAKLPKGAKTQLFYITDKNNRYTNDKSATFAYSEAEEFAEYVIYTADMRLFKDTITGLRIDPFGLAGEPFVIQSLTFIRLNAPENYSKQIDIDGNSFNMNFAPQMSSTGETLIAFDPAVALDYRLGLFHEWDADAAALTLYSPTHTVVFTVGSDAYTLDGVSRPLGFTLSALDGLPLIPIARLCGDLGYSFTQAAGLILIETPLKAWYDEHDGVGSTDGWEFEVPGYTEGFTSQNMTLSVANGYLSCRSTSDTIDPIIRLTGDIELDTARYGTFEIRVRYKYSSEKVQSIKFYYGTNVNSSHSEGKTIVVRLNSMDSGDEWETYTVDLTKLPNWKDTVISLRFDPFDAYGEMDVDYIRFIGK